MGDFWGELVGMFLRYKKEWSPPGYPRYDFFIETPHCELPTAGALESVSGSPVWFADADVKDFFYRLEFPPGLCKWSSLPGIACKHIPGLQSRLGCHSKQRVVPCLKVLPMGWKWSLRMAQQVHLSRIYHLGVPRQDFVKDKVKSISLGGDDTQLAV